VIVASGLTTRSMLRRPPPPPVVRISGLNHYFGTAANRKQVLADINLTLLPGEIVIMTGPSGSGKTTLLVLTGALRSVQEGTLEIMGRELRLLSPRELVDIRRDIGFIYQAHNLFESLTALENVMMALELHDYSARQRRALAQELLTKLGLGDRLHYKPGLLSGGQKQRIAVARALVNRPKIILADEPTAALDKDSGRIVVNLLKAHAKEQGGTIILVTHDNRILDIADRIVTMVDGRMASSVNVGEATFIGEFLKKCPVFQQQTPGELTDIAQKMAPEEVAVGAVIIRQGDAGDKFYLIRRGRVEVIVKDDEGERVVTTLETGSIFGERALLTDEPRNATVRALEDTDLYTLSKENFLAALHSSPNFTNQLLRVFAGREDAG
jgi:putative ABC transport system ATP-binding protein